jgi:putative Holliday junction resolvase
VRKLGVDPGMKRVGLSLSDEQGELASPLTTLARKDDAAVVAAIVESAANHEVDTIVVGLPLRMSGLEGPEAKRARLLAGRIERASGLDVVLWDERMTTLAAERELRGSGLKGEKKRARIDEAAATLLLQSYLDAKRGC